MARHQKEDYQLSDAEKRDLVQLIQQGKALPEKYRLNLIVIARFAKNQEI
jgi:site-specific DNA-methyltransferase (adenine-specific)/adenine-specific DNA-methyltransferase